MYLNVPDQLLGGRFYGNLVVDDALDGRSPPHGLVQHLGVEAIRVLPPVNHDVPVAWNTKRTAEPLEPGMTEASEHNLV